MKEFQFSPITIAIKPQYYTFAFLLFLSVYLFPLNGQSLLKSRPSSYYTYIYKITDREAKKLYKKAVWKIDPGFFHTLIDSFPTDSQYAKRLGTGHYLKTHSLGNKQYTSIQTIQNIQVFILNNNTDLCIQVYDFDGKIIPNATVKIKGKKLRFIETTQSYTDKKSNKQGLLCVLHNGHTSYFDLNRTYNNPIIKRGMRKVIYATPLKYAWMPVNYVYHLPIDGYKSIKRGWKQGTISQTVNFFVNSFEKIACVFDSYYCNNYKFSEKCDGYMVFNKPKYLPHDTVKFKAFITKNGKPINKELSVNLVINHKYIFLGKIKPYHNKGGYAFQFHLHDSLNLTLDQQYSITLNDKKDRAFQSARFQYEDYELSKNQLELKTNSNIHYRGNNYSVFASGTDENGLNLLDGRLEILICPKNINGFFNSSLFIPDTLWYNEVALSPNGETEIQVPDSAFPPINCSYTIKTALITSDNERVTKTKTVQYFYSEKKFNFKIKADSVFFAYTENGKEIEKDISISSSDVYGNRNVVFSGSTPCKMKLNPLFASYIVASDSLEETFSIRSKSSLVNCYSQRTSDSIIFQVDNPRKLHLSYNVYKLNHEKTKGFSDSLSIAEKTHGKQNYFVSLKYIWGGKVSEETYTIPLLDKKLNISVEQPKLVFPGQSANITVLVTDIDGKPVPNVDITAMGLTKKFNYLPPSTPNLQVSRKNKSIINNFSIKNSDTHPPFSQILKYIEWNSKIDSIEYYKFLYPKDSIYYENIATSDSTTQFSPFVVDKGEMLPVHLIYVDGVPVYFSWSTIQQPYSFRASFGYHHIKLRTSKYSIELDSIYFNWKEKTIISVDINAKNSKIKVLDAQPKLSSYEKTLLYKYIFPYRKNFGENYAYIKNGNNVQLISPSYNYNKANLAGPVNGKVNFKMVGGFASDFYHEPNFEYDFSPSLLKMRQIDLNAVLRNNLYAFGRQQPLNDVILTEQKIQAQWQEFLNKKRQKLARYQCPRSTSRNHGRLQFETIYKENKQQEFPLNLLVFRYDDPDFFRIYRGETSLIHELSEGYHRLIYFFPGSRYQIEDSIFIRKNGVSYYEVLQDSCTFRKDSFSTYVDQILEQNLFNRQTYPGGNYTEAKAIYESYQENFSYTGHGSFVKGKVVDEETREALPGVNVVLQGTTYGCVTNLNGEYNLNVPNGENHLSFTYLGYINKNMPINGNTNIDVSLRQDVTTLEEVVVVGYGTVKKSCLTGSVSTINSYSLLQAPPGVNANISQVLNGKVCGIEISEDESTHSFIKNITIRGAGTTSFDNPPLIIINGNIYSGDLSDLKPDIIKNIQILKSESATALYGARAANGVLIIDTEGDTFLTTQPINQKGSDADPALFEAASKVNSIRSNFSDYAFWQPSLVTDQEGKTTFTVKFPDDVTNWETHVFAMNNKKQSGQAQGSIKSYKPIMAQLSVPRFLVESDSAFAIGKTLNYMPDSIRFSSTFEIDGIKDISTERGILHSHIDTVPLVAHTDSIHVKYSIRTNNNYFDGEKRSIPVYQKGLEETHGGFYVLDTDTTIMLQADTLLGPVTLYANSSVLNVVDQEISRLIEYKYNCNEQMASKLKALLAENQIAKFKSEKFYNNKKAERFIRLLLKNQNTEGLWGWWNNSETSFWISLHVLEALTDAQQEGYNINLNTNKITETLLWELNRSLSTEQKIQILNILTRVDAKINIEPYLNSVRANTLAQLIHLCELKQRQNLKFYMDSLMGYQETTLFGNIYFTNQNEALNIWDNNIQNTLAMYRILRNDSTTSKNTLQKIRNYFYECRNGGGWTNTFESASIIKTILPDILNEYPIDAKTKISLSGDIQKEITEFPFEMKYDPGTNIALNKQGDNPVYVTAYQKYWNPTPVAKKSEFNIETYFEEKPQLTLQAGEPVTLCCRVKIKKDAQYVMINVPIPAGVSYASKANLLYPENHREYFKNETSIFCKTLSKGEYTFKIKLIPRYSGCYTLNPAKVELMYFPTFNANNELKKVRVDGIQHNK